MNGSLVQQLIVVAIVMAAAGFLALKAVRAIAAARSKRAAACASGCGCAPAAPSPAKAPEHPAPLR